MRLFDPFLFLIGNRNAILRIAGSYWSILVGFLLVISAGIARNYDHLAFLKNPEWFLGPIAASIASCCIIYGMCMWKHNFHPDAKLPFLSFLSIYWMTAPCAWIYGIPVEAVTDILTATKWNIAFLGIVATWRVLLMIRCLNLLTGISLYKATLTILFPSTLIIFGFSFNHQLNNLVNIMGGVRLSPKEDIVNSTIGTIASFSFLGSIILLILVPATLIYESYKKLPKYHPKALPWLNKPHIPYSALTLSIILILSGLIASSKLQSKIINNHKLQTLIDEDSYAAATKFVATKELSDFSRIHYLPPNPIEPGALHQLNSLLDITDHNTPAWIIEEWQQNLKTLIDFNVHISMRTYYYNYELPANERTIPLLPQNTTMRALDAIFNLEKLPHASKLHVFKHSSKPSVVFIVYALNHDTYSNSYHPEKIILFDYKEPETYQQIWPQVIAPESWGEKPIELGISN